MATPKKENKIRDYDRTRKRMLELVGEILTDTGYAGLTTNNIARRLAKDKGLIRYYFDNLNNLKKTFILENDHWATFFKEVDLPGNLDENEIKTIFKTLVHEHFAFFMQNPKTQKIMLWQLTDTNPVIKSVVNHRVKESERIIKIAALFLRSETQFRLIMELVFGGLYFMALQAEAGNGSLWGTDINLKTEHSALMEIADQLIDWAWVLNGREK